MRRGLRRILNREWAAPLLLIGVCLFFSVASPRFATEANLGALARHTSEGAFIAAGMALVILTGGIDLSVGSIAGLAGMVCGLLVHAAHGSAFLAVLGGVGVGLVAGSANGALIGFTRLAPVVVTLASWAGCRSAAYLLTHGDPVGGLPDSLMALSVWNVAGWVPLPTLVAAIIAVTISVVLHRTAWGRSMIAMGRNRAASRFSGLPNAPRVLSAYAASGLLAGLAGVWMTARAGAAVPDGGTGMELEAITAVLLGGGRIEGGNVSMSGAMAAAAALGALHNGCDLMGWDSSWQTLVVGLCLLGAAAARGRQRS